MFSEFAGLEMLFGLKYKIHSDMERNYWEWLSRKKSDFNPKISLWPGRSPPNKVFDNQKRIITLFFVKVWWWWCPLKIWNIFYKVYFAEAAVFILLKVIFSLIKFLPRRPALQQAKYQLILVQTNSFWKNTFKLHQRQP